MNSAFSSILNENVIDLPERSLPFYFTGNVHDVADVKRQWSCLNMMSANPQTPSLEDVFSSDGDMIETQKFIRRIVKKWDTSMNLYTHNCQHFSWFVKNQLREEEICML